MQTFALVFIADDETWPDMETTIHEESFEMAIQHAGKLLQRRCNTMFCEVNVCHEKPNGQITEIRTVELLETRGVRVVEAG